MGDEVRLPQGAAQPAGLLRVIVKRVWFDQIAAGRKTIEYRRHKPPFTAKVFYPGREFWLDWRHSHKTLGEHGILCVCTGFDVAPLGRLATPVRSALIDTYQELNNASEIAMIYFAQKHG